MTDRAGSLAPPRRGPGRPSRSVAEARQIADLAEKYSPNGEIRFTVEQNLLLPNVRTERQPSTRTGLRNRWNTSTAA